MRWWRFSERVPGKSKLQVFWWALAEGIMRIPCIVLYGLKVRGKEHVPTSGSVLFISNHQSFLDPMCNGAATADRQYTIIAKRGLFLGPFGWIIRSLGAKPISDSGGDGEALRISIAELQAGRCVCMYPEGSRSPDGTVQPFRRGLLLLIRKAKPKIVPMGIAGSYSVWPRSRKLPRFFGTLRVTVGAALDGEAIAAMPPDEALVLLEQAVRAQYAEALAWRGLPEAAP